MFGFLFPRRKPLSEYLPWRFMLTPDTIVTRTGPGGGLMTSVYLTPQDLETAGSAALDVCHAQLGDLMGRLGGGWTLWQDMWRWRTPQYLPDAGFGGIAAAERVDASRRKRFEAREARVFENSIYLTLQYMPHRTDGVFEYLVGKEHAGSQQGVFDRYNEAVREWLGELSQIYKRVEILQEQALGSYISQTVNFEPSPAFLPSGWIAEQLGSSTWITGLRPKINRNHVRTVEMFTIGAVTADTLEPLYMLPFECRWVVRTDTMTRETQAKRVQELIGQFDSKRKNWFASLVQHWTGRHQADTNLTAAVQKAEAQQLKIEIEMAELGFATTTVNVHTWHPDPEQADYQAEYIETLLKGKGFRAEVAQLNATFALLADIPGNPPSERELPAMMAQITRLSPVTGITRGSLYDRKWDGPALLVGNSTRGLPIRFSFHSPGEDVGNMAIFGQSGSGKSALISKMAMSALKYRNSRVLVFDRGRSFMVPCLCSGGDWIELGEGGIGVQPLRNIHEPAQFAMAHDWLCKALRFNEVVPDDAVKQALTSALQLLKRKSIEERTISGLVDRIAESRAAKNGLSIFRADGPWGQMFDGVVPGFGKSRVVGIECDAIMRLDVAPLVILAVFRANQRERMSSGDPFVVFFDEARAMLTHPAFASEIDSLSREIRKANGVLVLASQSQADFDDSQMTRVIVDQMKNLVFLPDPNATRPQTADFYKRLGLEEDHIQAIAEGRQKGDYFFVSPEFMRMIEVRLDGDALAICGRTEPRDKMMAMQLLHEGVKPGPEFLERWLEYARQGTQEEDAA